MAYCSDQRTGLHAAVYEAVDASVALQRCLPAAVANVQRALLHSQDDPEAVRQLESMSVHLHQLTAATMRCQQTEREAAVNELSRLAGQWMTRLPMQ